MADLLPIHAIYDGTTPKYFFRTSDVYGETGGVGEKVNIKKVKDADLTGKEEIMPVKELLRTGILFRIGIRYKNSAGKRKSGRVLVRNTAMTKLFADNAPDKLEGVQYKVGTSEKGSIVQIGMIRRATSY
jgi:hypothetical protein